MSVHAFDVQPDGSLINHRSFARMSSPEESVPDGMKVDIQGRVFCTGPGGTWVFDSIGSICGRYERRKSPPIVPSAARITGGSS
jgi:sugar lactone lactonase YvrE